MEVLLSKIASVSKVNVIGIKLGEQNSYSLLTLKRSGSLVQIAYKRKSVSEEELVALDKNVPVIVHLDGKGVLNKKIDLSDAEDLSWKKSIDARTICMTEFVQDSTSFISFCRSNAIEDLISRWSAAKITVLGVYAGPFISAILQPALNVSEITTAFSRLSFQNGNLRNFEKTQLEMKRYALGNLELDSENITLYAAGVAFFAKPANIFNTLPFEISSHEFIYGRAFRTAGIAIMLFFFSTLLCSYLLIQHYIGKNAELTMQTVLSDKAFREISDLEIQLKQKQDIVSGSALLSERYLSYYAYEIVRNAPLGIAFTELEVNPLVKKIDENENVEFESKTIRLKGNFTKDQIFDGWIDKLKKEDWVKKLEIQSLENKKQSVSFTVVIKV